MGKELSAQVRRALDDRSAAKSALTRSLRTSLASEAIAFRAHRRGQAQSFTANKLREVALLAFAAMPHAQTIRVVRAERRSAPIAILKKKQMEVSCL